MKASRIIKITILLLIIPKTFLANSSIYENYRLQQDPSGLTGHRHIFNHVSMHPPDRIKIFVSPGTVYLNLMFYAQRNDIIGVEITFNKDKTDTYPSYHDYDSFNRLPWITTEGVVFCDYSEALLFKNRGGTVKALEMTISPIMTGETWFYIKTIHCVGKFIKANSTQGVSLAEYRDWYAGASWDPRGDPIQKESPMVIGHDEMVELESSSPLVLGGVADYCNDQTATNKYLEITERNF